VIDKFTFRQVNENLKRCVKVKSSGDSKYEEGKIVSKEAFEEERKRCEEEDKTPPTYTQPELATNETQLLASRRPLCSRRASSALRRSRRRPRC